MSTSSLQIHRFALLGASVAGLVLLLYLLNTGWLQAAVADLEPRTSLVAFQRILENTPGRAGHAYLAWFHYLLFVTLFLCCLQVACSLLKPVRNPVLLTVNWAILLSAASAGLFFWAFGLYPRAGAISLLTVQAAVVSCALAMHAFGRVFLVFPAELTEARAALYIRRYLRSSAEANASKHTATGRWRRRLLAWQLRRTRRWHFVRSIRKERIQHYNAAQTRRLLLYTLPGLTLSCLALYWGAVFAVRGPAIWPVVLMPAPMICLIAAWSIVINKIVMDYRLGDAALRKQVLWLFIGTSIPSWLGGAVGLVFMLPFFAPQLFGEAMIIMTIHFPLLAFLLFVLCLMISIFFYGAIDAERVLRVGTLYSFLSLVLTVLFAVIEQLLSPILINALGMDGMAGSVVSATVVALTFRPLRSRIETGIDRGFARLLGGPSQLMAGTDLAQTGTRESAG